MSEFGKYVLQHKLAEGGMAEVFLAKQQGMEGFEKPVVIKRILPHLNDEPHFVEMFLNEAKVVARLSHPSIVHIFDFGRIDEQYYIAMEFIHGEDLRNLFRQADKTHKLPSPAIASRIMADMLGGLHYAHTRLGSDGRPLGLVHRDISPQNVIVTFEGGVKLVDFGIAKATAQAAQQTQTGLLKGKYSYMSPEQARGKPLDARSDVFSVGILLWELLTWRRLFRRDNDMATMVAVAEDPAPAVSSIRGEVPPELDRIVARALARPVAERYQNAQQMQADLEGLIRTQGWEADSIKLQRFMRDLFADKLRMQDEAIRAAGVGSIEDFLARVDEGTQMSWIDGKPGERRGTPASNPGHAGHAGPVGPISAPSSFRPSAIAPPPNWPAGDVGAGPAPSETSNTTLGGAVGESSLVEVDRVALHSGMSPVFVEESVPAWKRAIVVTGTAMIVATVALAAIYWPAPDLDQEDATGRPVAVQPARVKVLADPPAYFKLDGVTHPPAVETEVEVRPGVEHVLYYGLNPGGRPRKLRIPPLEPGAIHVLKLGPIVP